MLSGSGTQRRRRTVVCPGGRRQLAFVNGVAASVDPSPADEQELCDLSRVSARVIVTSGARLPRTGFFNSIAYYR